ncbi:DUF742 domain-containing protein [Amycolatopsis pigmentata]|uniref:DUF742 domain-containing protein n=1 Tax=Amycolatopsis pigmentata TaxID=450801 RepID=A0ABW5G0P2_9PSEU
MSPSDNHKTTRHPEGRGGTRFGGWSDYGEWAEHDFRPRTAAEEGTAGASSVPVVEVLTDLAPITVREPEDPSGTGSRTSCTLMPSPRDAEAGRDPGAAHLGEHLAVILDDDVEPMLVRPYVRAGGRAEAKHQLEFETVVSSTGLHESWPGERELSEDQLLICEHCDSPRSVAEIAAAINAPIGVAQVLIGDAIDRGLLVLHETAPVFQGRPPLALLKRVHAGIAKLA